MLLKIEDLHFTWSDNWSHKNPNIFISRGSKFSSGITNIFFDVKTGCAEAHTLLGSEKI
jgi:hypothetical protein